MGKTQKIVGLILILVALGMAAYAWVVSNRMAAEQKAAQPKLQPVVVAQTRIPADTVITAAMVKVAMLQSRPEGSYSDITAVTGKIASTDIVAGESLLHERLGGGLRAMVQHIDPGHRALAIRVDDVIAVGNKLAPGDWVDVFFTLRRNNEEIPNTQSRLLLENLQVLAFGSRDVGGAKPSAEGGTTTPTQSRASSETPKTAVLSVNLIDIDKLVLAAASGHLILALRPHEPAAVATAAVVPGAPPAAKADAGKTADAAKTTTAAKPVVAAKPALQPLTLKQLIAMTGGATSGKSGKRAAPRPPGDAVVVMHGLDEKTVHVSAGGEAKP